jgi:hypothetical protein
MSPRPPRRAFVGLALLLLLTCLAPLGCRQHLIPNTDVEDTNYNRDVLTFCEDYRRAVERRNIPLLLKLAHAKYYEDGGNIDSSDDLDKAGLEEYLSTKFRDVTGVRYEIRYRRITDGKKGTVLVDYTYSASYKVPTPEGEVWRRTVADNRLVLLPEKDSKEGFRILAGM